MVVLAFVNGGAFFQLILELSQGKTKINFLNVTMQTILEVLILLHCLSVFKDILQNKTLTVSQDYYEGTLIGLSALHLLKI